jgi:hypothetical protein
MPQKWTVGKVAGLFVEVFLDSLTATMLLQAFKQESYPIIRQKRQDTHSALGHAVSNIRSVAGDSDDKNEGGVYHKMSRLHFTL